MAFKFPDKLNNDTIGYAYNDAARTVTRTSPGGMTQTSTTDAYGRIDSIANVLGTFTNTYDGVGGPLTQITHTGANAGFDTAFTYLGDDFNRALATITSYKPGAAAVSKHTYTVDPLGNIATWKRETPLANPSGPTQQFQSTAYYDQGDQLTSLINQPISGSASVTNGFHYTYDPAGNIASKQIETSASDTTISTYNHNTLNQISSSGGTDGVKPITVRGSTNESATVKLKPNLANHWKDARMLSGNRFEAETGLTTGSNQIHIQAKDGSNNVSNYTYTLNLTTPPAASPTYDADGNMTSDGVRSYEWDIQSRLMKIIWGASSNQTTSYRYNALGQRSEQIEMTGTTETAHYYYLYNGIQRIARFNGGNETSNIDRQYLSQGEQRKNGNNWDSYYYNRAHLGSVREVMNSDGTLAARYDYDPYGKRSAQYQSSTYSDGCDLAYTGHYIQPSPVVGQTELELTFYRAYDPELGIWLSKDPTGEDGGINLYGYVGNNPINGWDPLGLARCKITTSSGRSFDHENPSPTLIRLFLFIMGPGEMIREFTIDGHGYSQGININDLKKQGIDIDIGISSSGVATGVPIWTDTSRNVSDDFSGHVDKDSKFRFDGCNTANDRPSFNGSANNLAKSFSEGFPDAKVTGLRGYGWFSNPITGNANHVGGITRTYKGGIPK